MKKSTLVLLILSMTGCEWHASVVSKPSGEAPAVAVVSPSVAAPTPPMICDDAISSVVYRRLNDEIDVYWNPTRGQAQLKCLSSKVEKMPDSCAKRAYIYWIPEFTRQASDFKRMDEENAAADRISSKVQRP